MSSLSKRKRAKVGMASTGSVSSHHTSKENTGVSKTEEHVERLLMLLCGASAQAGSEEVVIGLSDLMRCLMLTIKTLPHVGISIRARAWFVVPKT